MLPFLFHAKPTFSLSLSLEKKAKQRVKARRKYTYILQCIIKSKNSKGGGCCVVGGGGAEPFYYFPNFPSKTRLTTNEMTSNRPITTTSAAANGARHHYYPPTTSSPSSSSSASFRGCCCCLFLLFSFLALLILAVILIIVLAVKPKKPEFELQQVGVQYMGISPTTASSATVSLNIRMVFTAANDNKVGIKYGESRFTIMYRGIPLGRATVPGFYQPAHSVRRIEIAIAVDRVNLLQADAADLLRDASLNDRVELRVVGDVGAKIRILSFTSPGVEVSLSP
ncbi:hypothetical protein CDL12_23649 [Handroanthus impetiginosus]|uniref:Late embryogenesis abundant protein LEA-2 subgroup domain-containing protein n=1 Tax=Handroanthus impetiginosus TaxID=429701 RepID=A0A2G9GEV5_9LAMI|nr:hypothetical protein CDL12_23649 [Handroanthus impetiginosus]